MEKITRFEFRRQMFHILLGVLIVMLLMYGFIGSNAVFAAIIIGAALSYLSLKARIPLINGLLEKFERKNELKKFPGKGAIFYLVGVYISLFLFPKDVAMASIMVLALGDSISHLFGLHFGRIKNPLSKTKFIEGAIAGFLAGFAGALVFLPWHEAFFASLAAMTAEAVEIKIGAGQVDDNLIVPFVAGAAVWIIRMI